MSTKHVVWVPTGGRIEITDNNDNGVFDKQQGKEDKAVFKPESGGETAAMDEINSALEEYGIIELAPNIPLKELEAYTGKLKKADGCVESGDVSCVKQSLDEAKEISGGRGWGAEKWAENLEPAAHRTAYYKLVKKINSETAANVDGKELDKVLSGEKVERSASQLPQSFEKYIEQLERRVGKDDSDGKGYDRSEDSFEMTFKRAEYLAREAGIYSHVSAEFFELRAKAGWTAIKKYVFAAADQADKGDVEHVKKLLESANNIAKTTGLDWHVEMNCTLVSRAYVNDIDRSILDAWKTAKEGDDFRMERSISSAERHMGTIGSEFSGKEKEYLGRIKKTGYANAYDLRVKKLPEVAAGGNISDFDGHCNLIEKAAKIAGKEWPLPSFQNYRNRAVRESVNKNIAEAEKALKSKDKKKAFEHLEEAKKTLAEQKIYDREAEKRITAVSVKLENGKAKAEFTKAQMKAKSVMPDELAKMAAGIAELVAKGEGVLEDGWQKQLFSQNFDAHMHSIDVYIGSGEFDKAGGLLKTVKGFAYSKYSFEPEKSDIQRLDEKLKSEQEKSKNDPNYKKKLVQKRANEAIKELDEL